MSVYISFLRGINVGGKRIIRMADLKALYETLGFKNVTTYIQSGNVVFTSKAKSEQLTTTISAAIQKQFGFEVPVIIRSADELHQLQSQHPFLKHDSNDGKQAHVTLLASIPDPALVQKIMTADVGKDRFQIMGNNVFIYCEGRYSDSVLTNTFLEKKLGTTTTTRNWETIQKLVALSAENE